MTNTPPPRYLERRNEQLDTKLRVAEQMSRSGAASFGDDAAALRERISALEETVERLKSLLFDKEAECARLAADLFALESGEASSQELNVLRAQCKQQKKRVRDCAAVGAAATTTPVCCCCCRY